MKSGFLAVPLTTVLLFITASVSAENINEKMHRAIQLSLKGKNGESLKVFQEIASANPNNFYAYNNMGMVYFKTGQNDKALEAYKKALEINPDFSMTLNNIAQIYKERGQYDLAESHLKKSIEAFKDMDVAYANLGEVYLLQKRFDDAIPYLEEANKRIPTSAQYHEFLAEAYEGKGMKDKAKKERDLANKFKVTPALPGLNP